MPGARQPIPPFPLLFRSLLPLVRVRHFRSHSTPFYHPIHISHRHRSPPSLPCVPKTPRNHHHPLFLFSAYPRNHPLEQPARARMVEINCTRSAQQHRRVRASPTLSPRLVTDTWGRAYTSRGMSLICRVQGEEKGAHDVHRRSGARSLVIVIYHERAVVYCELVAAADAADAINLF